MCIMRSAKLAATGNINLAWRVVDELGFFSIIEFDRLIRHASRRPWVRSTMMIVKHFFVLNHSQWRLLGLNSMEQCIVGRCCGYSESRISSIAGGGHDLCYKFVRAFAADWKSKLKSTIKE